MKIKLFLTASILFLSGLNCMAGEDSNLLIDGQIITVRADPPPHMEDVDVLRSGWTFRRDETQALQMDDFDNPAFVFVDQGIDLFNKVEGSSGKSCASCHTNVEDFSGLRAKMPVVRQDKIVSMEELVNDCRTERMGAEAWKWSSTSMTAITALIGLQSRGMPINVKIDGDATAHWEKGKQIY